MRVKRVLAVLLAAALTASLLVLPVSAAPGSFRDVSDPETAVNADILRLMGVVNGMGDNRFEPNGALTRAQFCTMVVKFLQKESEAARYATRTIFSDVGGSHWARSYVNFAATNPASAGDGASNPLVAGVGDGKFLPDNNITLAEAATILLRALGYSGQEAGSVWPQGYLDLAASIGLTDGLPSGAGSVLTRAQAARLFVNALKCSTAGGQVYYKSLGTVSPEKSIILAVNTTTDDGTRSGAVRVVTGANVQAYLPAQGDGNPVSLLNRRGELVLNARNEIVTFLPDNSTRLTAVLDGDAKSGSFKGKDGKQYTIGKDIPIYVADDGEDSGYQASQTYETVYEKLTSGTQVTMYSESGKVATVFAAIPGASISADAVVVMGAPSAATFYQLTGGATDFILRRGKDAIALGDLRDYDVVTYDKVTKTLIVSDLRLSCVYGEADPSPKNPKKIKVLGNEFDVLESAWHTANRFKPGDSVVLLLTADGRVAGMEKPGSQVRSTAAALVKGGVPELFLPNGETRKLTESVSTANVDGRLVILSGGKNAWTAVNLSTARAPGDYRVSAARLGSLTVASDVRVYEQFGAGAMAPVDGKELTSGAIPASKIAAYRQNSSGLVDFIVLEGVTGNAYAYGMMKSTTIDSDTGETSTTWSLVRGAGKTLEFVRQVGYNGKSGDMVGVVTSTPKGQAEGGEFTLASIVPLTEVKGVKPGDFFTSQDAQYVTAGGRTYHVATDVECCRSSGGSRVIDVTWLSQETGAARLTAIKAYSDDLTIYVDPVGQQVRVIKAS